jgi:hypothetical protein
LLIARVLRGEGARGSVVEAADDYLREHLEEAIAEYRRLNTTGGTLGISSDAARELLPGYGTPAERTAKSNARHGGSSGEDQPWRAGARAVSWFLLGGGTLVALVCLFFILHSGRPSPHTDLASLLTQNPDDYALSFGHFLDLTGPAMALFRVPLALTAVGLFGGALSHFLLRRRGQGHAATLALAAGAFLFLLATHRGLAIFSPTLTSYQLAERIAPVLRPDDLVVIHGEYEAGSTLGFYLRRNDLHLVEGRSSNLWYGSFFPDAPRIFETRESIAAKWRGPRRIFLWQDPHDPERKVLELPGKVYVVADSGGKEILSNQPKE